MHSDLPSRCEVDRPVATNGRGPGKGVHDRLKGRGLTKCVCDR